MPYVGNLRGPEETWQDALTTWLNGHILCEEQKRYVGNFLSVHRVRPQNDDSDAEANSDDIISDEELQVSSASLAEAKQRRGRKKTQRKAAHTTKVRNLQWESRKAIGVSATVQLWKRAHRSSSLQSQWSKCWQQPPRPRSRSAL